MVMLDSLKAKGSLIFVGRRLTFVGRYFFSRCSCGHSLLSSAWGTQALSPISVVHEAYLSFKTVSLRTNLVASQPAESKTSGVFSFVLL